MDDVLLPLRIVRLGYRVVFEPSARAYDQAPLSADRELERKTRTLVGNFQLFARELWLLSPWHNRLWTQTVSHKLLRHLVPLFLIALFVSNLLLIGHRSMAVLLALQVLFYLAAGLGWLTRRTRLGSFPLLSVPYYFSLVNTAAFFGVLRLVFGRVPRMWAPRADEGDG